MKKYFLSVIGLLMFVSLFAQTSVYDQKEAFNPQFYPYPGNDFRSGSGEPGSRYWQNLSGPAACQGAGRADGENQRWRITSIV